MAFRSKNVKPLKINEKIALLASAFSLLISSLSLWESDMNRRLTERTSQRAGATDKETRRLTEILSRPWITVSAVTLDGGEGNLKGFIFKFKNLGTSPATKLEIAPGISWGSDSINIDEVERSGMREIGTV